MLGENNAIIGAGGIGSYFCAHLHKAVNNVQFGPTTTKGSFTVFDPKHVDEDNVFHQDFVRQYEMNYNKATVMATRYGFLSVPRKIVESDLSNYNSFIVCADNKAVRNMIYEHCTRYNKPFIDLRCQADTYAFYTEKVPYAELMTSLGSTEEERNSATGYSCMTAQDKAIYKLHMGNAAVAIAGIQLLLARWRNEPYPYKKDLVTVI